LSDDTPGRYGAAVGAAPAVGVRPPSRRRRELDGLRGIAAFVVLIHHNLLPMPVFAAPLYVANSDPGSVGWLIWSPLHVLFAGTEAVLVFFVLSGLVLTLPVLATPRYDWAAYYPQRLVRLYLPVLGAVVWAVIVVMLLPRIGIGANPSLWMAAHDDAEGGFTPVADAFLLAGTSNLDGPLWSLRWEVLFSLLLPLYVLVARRLPRYWIAGILIIAVADGLFVTAGYAALQYLPVFAIGALLAVALDDVGRLAARIQAGRRPTAVWGGLTALAVLGITAHWTIGPRLGPFIGVATTSVVLGATLFVFIALGSPAARALLTSRVVQWLGAISFSLYLVHEPIVVGVAQLLGPAAAGWTIFIALPLSLAAGWGFSRLVERPSHRLAVAIRHRVERLRQRSPKLQARTDAFDG
jgi:peptidoglycan/LPS O-acetylase OafA/YrhL